MDAMATLTAKNVVTVTRCIGVSKDVIPLGNGAVFERHTGFVARAFLGASATRRRRRGERKTCEVEAGRRDGGLEPGSEGRAWL